MRTASVRDLGGSSVCGIVGVWWRDRNAASARLVMDMTERLHHRGPDATGLWSDGGAVVLGHTRLAIIDLDSSAQPMTSRDQRVQLAYNGEVLNYRELRRDLSSYPFATHGDTEVVLAVYERFGPQGVQKLRGQFAYAIHDSKTGELHLFRDRLGILPLYYYSDEKLFAFASEIKALLPLIPSPDIEDEALYEYLAHRVVPAPGTLIKGVRKVLPGHYVTVSADGRCVARPYWNLPDESTERDLSAKEAVELVEMALADSVREALVADVPVGVYLSGGLDSSLIAAMASKGHPDLQTFSAGFGNRIHDESPWAAKVSRQLGTVHRQVDVTPDDFMQKWRELSWYRDGPLSEPADIAVNCLARLAREHVKVVLSGEGGDELFGGYPKYRFAVATKRAGGRPASALMDIAQRCIPANQSRLRVAVRALSEESYEERMRGWFAPFTATERRILLGGDPVSTGLDPYRSASGDPLRRMLYADMFTWLGDNLLERGDRMSMAASLETRPPFLDHRLVELAFSLPSRFKVRRGRGKWVLKEVARRHLPSDVVDRRKIGFKVPLEQWFRGEMKDFAYACLTDPLSYVGQRFDRAAVARLLDGHLDGGSNEDIRIWTLLSLEVWHCEMISRGVF